MKEKCRFCSIVNDNLKNYGSIDEPFAMSEKYFSLVSIGAFVEGWTLLIPKSHKYNLRKDYESIEFYNYLKKHIAILRERLSWDKKIIVFEHGANKCDSETACGTSHAHLHVLPFSENVLTDILEEKHWIKCDWKTVASVVKEHEYLLYCEEPDNGALAQVYVHIVNNPESQYFRRVIFDKIGLMGSYSYKEDPRIEESMQTKKMLEG